MAKKLKPIALCELCEAEEVYNFHHFIPRTLHSNKWFKSGIRGSRCRRVCGSASPATMPSTT